MVESGIRRTIVVFSTAVKKEARRVEANLKKRGIGAEVFELCESDANALSSLLCQMRAFKPDCVVGLGGGHCLDISKVARVLYEDPGTTLRSLAMGTDKNDTEKGLKKAMIHRRGSLVKKLICIPTTCGSGSEVTSTAVLRNDDGRQMIVSGVAFLPDISIIDSSFIQTIPRFVAAITGIRALLHGLESYISLSASPYSSCMAFQSLSVLFEKLVSAVTEGNMYLLQDIHKSASISGVAIAATDVGLGTIIARSISEVFTLPHGLVDAIVINHALAFNTKKGQTARLLSDLSVRLGLSGSEVPEDERIQALLDKVTQIKKSLFLPSSLCSLHSTLLRYKNEGWLEPIGDEAFQGRTSPNTNSGDFQISNKLNKDNGEHEGYIRAESVLKAIPVLGKKTVICNLRIGVFRENLDKMISRALSDGAMRSNPVEVSKEDLREIFEKVWGSESE
ncbi:Iron-containing alcohol dehydrogenase [Cryptosporidium felis]|nr:Iron-containing alcohol dehydrogenase [Cryptosporidium felis]